MDRKRLEYALQIVASQPCSSVGTAFASMVNLIIENHENALNLSQETSSSVTKTHSKYELVTESHTSQSLKPATDTPTSDEQTKQTHTSHEPPTESHISPTESGYVQKFRKIIELTPIDGSLNYCDEEGYVYSSNNSKQTENFYFRCKYINSHKCNARVIVYNQNIKTAVLTQIHTHPASKIDLTKTKFDAKIDKICNDRKFITNRVAYMEAREDMSEADVPYLPNRHSYDSFVQRRKRKFEPKIPLSLEEFELFVNDEKYKQRYTHDLRNSIFYRGIWASENNDSMIAYLSETAMKVLQTETDMIEILMDGTFSIWPTHIKFSQLYILSFTYKERSYPFGYIFMEKRDTESYDCLFANLIALWDKDVELKVFKIMTDYERAVRKSARKYFPNAPISGYLGNECVLSHVNMNHIERVKEMKFVTQVTIPMELMSASVVYPPRKFNSVYKKTRLNIKTFYYASFDSKPFTPEHGLLINFVNHHCDAFEESLQL